MPGSQVEVVESEARVNSVPAANGDKRALIEALRESNKEMLAALRDRDAQREAQLGRIQADVERRVEEARREIQVDVKELRAEVAEMRKSQFTGAVETAGMKVKMQVVWAAIAAIAGALLSNIGKLAALFGNGHGPTGK